MAKDREPYGPKNVRPIFCESCWQMATYEDMHRIGWHHQRHDPYVVCNYCYRDPHPATLPRVAKFGEQIRGVAIYVGRAFAPKGVEASIWGNPFRVSREQSREKAVRKYITYINRYQALKARLPELRHADALLCWCRASGKLRHQHGLCHADVLIDILDHYSDDDLREGVMLDELAIWERVTYDGVWWDTNLPPMKQGVIPWTQHSSSPSSGSAS